VELSERGLPRAVLEPRHQPRSVTTPVTAAPASNLEAVDEGETAAEWTRRDIESVVEVWKVDDEWWRQPISRRYVEVVMNGGKHTVLFVDLTTNEWFEQTP
jgi:hypothetical protein